MAGFNLSSTETALAILAPLHLQSELDLVRKDHDKAYGKWDSHINVIYPFVPLSSLPTTLSIIRKLLLEERRGELKISFQDVGSFKHRRNTTAFLKPSEETYFSIMQLRNYLITGLSASFKSERHEYEPHLTLGQMSLDNQTGFLELTNKIHQLVNMEWSTSKLAILKRISTGEMVLVEELEFGDPGTQSHKILHMPTTQGSNTHSKRMPYLSRGWKSCYQLNHSIDWTTFESEFDAMMKCKNTTNSCFVASLNIMADEIAPKLEERLPYIEKYIEDILPCDESPKVICYQEANSEILSALYTLSIIKTKFPYSSHNPDLPMQSLRNSVILASIPFRQFSLQYTQRHKSTLIVKFLDHDITIANVHLTSALTDQTVEIKKEQLNKIFQFLDRNDLTHENIIAGDFNLTTSSETIRVALGNGIISSDTIHVIENMIDYEIWNNAYIEQQAKESDIDDLDYLYLGEDGATFDKIINPLATVVPRPSNTENPWTDDRPQHYSRLLFTKSGSISLEKYSRFAIPQNPKEFISDHYGVFGLFEIFREKQKLKTSLRPSDGSRTIEKLIPVVDDTDIERLLTSWLPTEKDEFDREQAMLAFKQILSNDELLKNVLLAPLGSYALGTYFKDSDLDLLVIGHLSPRAFWDTAFTCLNSATAQFDATNLHIVNSLVQILEIKINSIKFDVQYCQAPELIAALEDDPKRTLETIVMELDLLGNLKPNSLRALNTYRDTVFLLNTLPNLASFKIAHRYLSMYLRRRGLYSARFGYLGGIHLSLLLNRVAKLLPQNISPASLVRTFFKYYAELDWSKRIICDPSQEFSMHNASRTNREAVIIRSIFTPTARPNVAESCSLLSAQLFSSEFSMASTQLAEGHWSWGLRPVVESISDFLNDADMFVRVKLDMWDVSTQTSDLLRTIIGSVESKTPGLLANLAKFLVQFEAKARIWPGRFVIQADASAVDTDGDSLSGYYLISVTPAKPIEEDNESIPLIQNDADAEMVRAKVVSAARSFERVVMQAIESRGENKAWASVDVVGKKKIWDMTLVLDTDDWAARGTKAGTKERAENISTSATAVQSSATPQTDKRSRMPLPYRASDKRQKKLRPVQDIIARIKWDEAYDVDDFLIGYQDRFAGIMEMPLCNWKADQTDLEFIPTHRIVWIRRQGGDGEKVWDRRTRYDGLFGSGIQRSEKSTT